MKTTLLSAYGDRIRAALARSRSESSPAFMKTAVPVYVATVAYLLVWWILAPDHHKNQFFREGGTIDWLSTVFLATAALFAWLTWAARKGEREPARWFWLASSAGLAFLSIADRFQVHERIQKQWLEPLYGDPTVFRNWNDIAVILYGVIGLVVLLAALPAALQHRLPRRLLIAGFACYTVHTLIDILLPRSHPKTLFEEGFKVLAGCSLMLAYASAAMITWSRQPRVSWRSAAVFYVLLGIVALPLVLGGAQWQKDLVHRWGDPASWLVSVLFAIGALVSCLAWRFGQPGSRRPRALPWFGAAVVMALLAVYHLAAASFLNFRFTDLKETILLLIGPYGVSPDRLLGAPALIGFALVVLLLWVAGGWTERGARWFVGVATAALVVLVFASFLLSGNTKSLVAIVGAPLAAASVLLATLRLIMGSGTAQPAESVDANPTGGGGTDG
jgi:hypothetical protein